MNTVHFSGSVTIDESFKKHNGEKAAARLKTIIDAQLAPLKDEKFELKIRSKTPSDFEAYARDIIEGEVTQTDGKTKRVRLERIHGNLFTAAATSLLAGIHALGSPFSRKLTEYRNIFWSATHFRTESLENFIAKAFSNIRADLKGEKAAQ